MPHDLPPSFVGHPILYMATMFSLMLVVLLALEWLWRIGWSFFERPNPLKSPTTVMRIVIAGLLVGAVVRSGPDLLLLMRWPAIDPSERQYLELVDDQLDSISFIFMSAAWLIFRLGEPMLTYQLEKHPLPIHLWPTRRQLVRPLKIGMGVLVIAFALTFLR